MIKFDETISKMRRNPRQVRFKDLRKICDHFFGEPRKGSGSHRVYKTPWQGDPKINIQNHIREGKSISGQTGAFGS